MQQATTPILLESAKNKYAKRHVMGACFRVQMSQKRKYLVEDIST